MKKTIMKIAVPTLALGIAFAPVVSAAPEASTQVTVKTDVKVTVKVTAKEKEAVKKLANVTKNLSKVEASVTKLTNATNSFYAKAAVTPVSAQVEAEFYKSTSGKLKANSNQVKALKKQADKLAKKYKGTDALTATYKKIADLNTAISAASKNLDDLHNQFKAAVKVEDSKQLFAAINTNLSKVEANVAQYSKATVDFYAKAFTDLTVTSKAEAEFYASTSSKLKAASNQLITLKKQLDQVAAANDATAVAATNKKLTDLNSVIAAASKSLTDLHTQFKAEESKRQLTAVTAAATKVEVSVAELTKATVDFYVKAATDATVTAKAEAEFYTSTAAKLKANAEQVKVLKKQLDAVAIGHQDTVAVAAAYKKLLDLNNAITVSNKNLTDLHNQFKASLKADELKKQLSTITDAISKVEASVAASSKATVDFYTKAATDATVTALVEAEFYKNTSGALLENTKQLIELKKQLDAFVKTNGQSADTTAAYTKLTAQTKAIALAVEVLTNLHIQFKPVAPAATGN
jgi:hypothetical protein